MVPVYSGYLRYSTITTTYVLPVEIAEKTSFSRGLMLDRISETMNGLVGNNKSQIRL